MLNILKKVTDRLNSGFTLMECLIAVLVINFTLLIYVYSFELVLNGVRKNEILSDSIQTKFLVTRQIAEFIYGLSLPYWNRTLEIDFSDNKLIARNCTGVEIGCLELDENISVINVTVNKDPCKTKNVIEIKYYHNALKKNQSLLVVLRRCQYQKSLFYF